MPRALILLLSAITLAGYYAYFYQSESPTSFDQNDDLEKRSNKPSSVLTNKDLHRALETILDKKETQARRIPAEEVAQNNTADDVNLIYPEEEYELEFNQMNPSERRMTVRDLELEIQTKQAHLENIDNNQDISPEDKERDIIEINKKIEEAKDKLEFLNEKIRTHGLNHEEPEYD